MVGIMDDILTLRENNYENLFITCTHIDINKENEDNKEKHFDNIITDGFDWQEDERRAYDC